MTTASLRCTTALLVVLVAFALALVSLATAQDAGASTKRVAIQWTTDADIDLHIYDEVADHAYYADRVAIPTGELSEDIIPQAGDTGPHQEFYTDFADTTSLGVCVRYFASPSDSEPTTVSYTITDPGGATRSGSLTLSTPSDGAALGASPTGAVSVDDSADCSALPPPTATTGDTSGPLPFGASPHGTTLTGSVNPSGGAASYFFEYGLTNAFGQTTPVHELDVATTDQAIAADLRGLQPQTTYYYRLVACRATCPPPGAADLPAGLGATKTFSTPSYRPTISGWNFRNVEAPDVPYERMLIDYPDSAYEMVAPRFTLFGDLVQSVTGRLFYQHIFQPTFADGLCYGFAVTSLELFEDQSNPSFDLPYATFGLGSRVPAGRLQSNADAAGTLTDLIEYYHAKQLGLDSVLAVGATYARQRALETQGAANMNTFNRLAGDLKGGPELVLIVPTNVANALTGAGHAVVAWSVGLRNGGAVIYVYDPNAPGDDESRIEVSNSGGMALVNGNGDRSYDDGNWLTLAVRPAPDSAGNRRWFFDGANAWSFLFGATGRVSLHRPSFLATGTSKLGIIDHGSRGLDGDFLTQDARAAIGQYRRGHFALVQSSRSGVSLHVNAERDGRSLQVRWPTDGRALTLGVGSQLGAGTGRALLVNGTGGHHRGIAVSATASADRFSLAGTSPLGDFVTTSTLETSTLSGLARLPVPLVIPRRGTRATLGALDWSHLERTVVYELLRAPSGTTLALLHGTPAQARRLPRAYRRLLRHCTKRRAGRHGRRYRVCVPRHR